jgi:hypothetical protein
MKKSFIKNRDVVTDSYIIVAACESYLKEQEKFLDEIESSDDFPPDCEENQVDYMNEVIGVLNHYQKIIDLHEYKALVRGAVKLRIMNEREAELRLRHEAHSAIKEEITNKLN